MFWVNPPRCSQRDFHGSPHASKIPANLTACGTPGAAGNVTQTHDLLDTSLRMFVPVNLCGWMGYVAHPTPDSRELCNSCPASGVTFRPCLAGLHQAISIHAPAWGATKFNRNREVNSSYFNSRPRVGGDSWLSSATVFQYYFNSRPRVGGDFKPGRKR